MGKAQREVQSSAVSGKQQMAPMIEKQAGEKFGLRRILVDLPPIKEDSGATIVSVHSSPRNSDKGMPNSGTTFNVSASLFIFLLFNILFD